MMRKFVVTSLAFVFCAASPTLSAVDELDQEAKRINQEARTPSAPTDTARAESLAKQYGVRVEKINAMRSGTGWGGVTIELALAQELALKDPANYPTMNDALAKVESLRAQKKGYGVVANELGLKVGPVISTARHETNQMRKESPGESSQAKPEKVGHPEHPEKPTKPEKPAKPDHPEHPQGNPHK